MPAVRPLTTLGKTALAPVDIPIGWDPRANQSHTVALIAACEPPPCSTPHAPQIKKTPQPELGGFFMPVVGVEPTRVISTRDFESPSSAIPTHRLMI